MFLQRKRKIETILTHFPHTYHRSLYVMNNSNLSVPEGPSWSSTTPPHVCTHIFQLCESHVSWFSLTVAENEGIFSSSIEFVFYKQMNFIFSYGDCRI